MNHYITEDGFLLSSDEEIEGFQALTDEQAKEFSTYSSTHTPSLVDGELAWTEKVVTMTEEEILQARKIAYADISTGSDPLFIEYQALIAKESDNAEAAKEAWLARREEIKLEYPKSS